MIITTVKGGRSSRDCELLVAHLFKTENLSIEILQIGHSAARDVAGVVEDMRILQAGSRATASLFHITLNPSIDCDNDTLCAAAEKVLFELDPDGQRPFVVVCHQKKRENSEVGRRHIHVLLANCDKNGRALVDGKIKIRTEYIANLIAWEHGEKPVLGRHHSRTLRRLRNENRHEVASWIIDAFGEHPDRPKSAMSSDTRQRAKRTGQNLPRARGCIAAAWERTQEVTAFRAALFAEGFTIVAGKKAGVLIVTDRDGNTVGALDRLLRKKRHEILKLMEASNEPGRSEFQNAMDGGSRSGALRPVGGNQREAGELDAITDVAGNPRSGGAGRSRRDHSAAFGNPGATATESNRNASDNRCKDGRITRYAHYRSLNRVRDLGRRMASVPALASYSRSGDPELADDIWRGGHDIWGIPIESSRKFQP